MDSKLNIFIPFIISCFVVLPASAQTEVIDSVEFPLVPEDALAEALMGIKLLPSDLAFRTDYVELDSFRLPIVDSLTLRPLDMIDFANDISASLFRLGRNSAAWLIGFESPRFPMFGVEVGYFQSAGESSPEYLSLSLESERLADCVGDALKSYINFIYRSNSEIKAEVDSFFAALNQSELAFIRDTFPELLLEDVEDEFRSVEELDSIQQLEEGFSKRFVPIAIKLVSDRSKWEELKRRALEFDRTVSDSALLMADRVLQACECDSPSFQIEIPTSEGKIAIGGDGRNLYTGRYIYILDIGGDDRYDLERVDAPQFVLDLSGNDQYNSLTDFAIASGFMYPSFLTDLKGDDTYSGRNFSLGSGLFSVGVLIDEAGNDKYYGDTHTQGAGTFGLGILIDESGSDNYNCALFGQAFAFVKGLGVLCDINGNDIYFAGGKYKDVLRYKDHYLSLSQGFAYGLRPRMSGGIAILADSSGHDTYISDIFGQGSSYWYALGIQTDFGGNDKYLSFQYAQGVGTHLTLGILLDKTGDDYYFAKGVSQGCGHDLAAGLLVDYFGNDTYQAYDLSQGAGSANGFGWLVDYRGNDSYQIKGLHNSQGYGNPRRDYGSVGLFMDLMGKDEYIGNGADSSIWIINSKWGIGVDSDFWEADSVEVTGE
jgi:hypothetical protein